MCTCPNGNHNAVTEADAWNFTRLGNPTQPPRWCTECPLNCLKLKEMRSPSEPFHLFSKWTGTPRNWASNHGDVVALANSFMAAQGIHPERPFDGNGGRKCMAMWLDQTDAPYPEGFEVHGDRWDVFQAHYQPNLPWHPFKRRTQSTVATIATAALRRLVGSLGRAKRAAVPTDLEFPVMLQVAQMQQAGQSALVEQTWREYQHRLQEQELDDEETEL